MIRLATSSWSLHGALGQVWYESDGKGGVANKAEARAATLSLLDLPAFVAKDGVHVLEICHFHFPSIEDVYLDELKAALIKADVELANILIDTGNLSSPDAAQRQADIDLNKRWQDIAAQVGAKGVRIDCGTEAPTPDALERSALALRELADYGAELGLKTTTENWRKTSQQPDDLLNIMQQADRPLQLCVDFGNAEHTPDKYATMQTLLPHATSLHCKGDFTDDQLDTEEFQRCLSLAKAADFDGHITLIYGATENEWAHILMLKAQVAASFPEMG